jgi:hypothetical protein
MSLLRPIDFLMRIKRFFSRPAQHDTI